MILLLFLLCYHIMWEMIWQIVYILMVSAFYFRLDLDDFNINNLFYICIMRPASGPRLPG